MRARAMLGAAALTTSAALVLSAQLPVAGYADGAPAGFSGGFDEASCHACHFSAAPDAGPGRVSVEGVSDRFSAGRQYPITVTLSRAGMAIAGFQLTARFKDDGAQAGSFAPASGDDARIGIDVQDGIQYVSQRLSGAALTAAETAAWSLLWTAPEGARPVVFHVAANAANADGSADGDHIHTSAIDLVPDEPSSR